MSLRRLAPALALVVAPALAAAAPSTDAVAAVRKTLDAALAIAHTGATHDEQLVALRKVARDILDTRTMGRRAIGDVLTGQPPPQQEAYFDLFDEVIVRAYLQKLLLFRDPRFGYAEPQRSDDGLIVPTTIATAKDEYHVNYEMREHDGRWVATDVIVEGVSLTDNYKAQFASLLRNRSFAELLDLMRSKTRPARGEPM